MKRSTTTSFKQFLTSSAIVAGAVAIVIATPIQLFADSYDEQIKAIQAQIDKYQSQASKLAQQSNTLQHKVDTLQAQINSIQAQVNLSQAKYDKLVKQIAETEKKIKAQSDFLGKTLVKLYVDSKISPLEMLAGSGSIGDFVDQQAYRSSIKDHVKDSIIKVQQLKDKLTDQKQAVKQVLDDQKAQRDQAQAIRNEQAQLLAATQGREAAYQKMIRDGQSDISRLRAEQRAANQALGGQVVPGDPNHGGYPAYLDNAPMDTLVDPWGMYNRECVSYTAWRVDHAYGNMPYWGGSGNANQWPGNAQAAGIPTGSTPKVGSVAISMSGYYGHAMWVEAVSGNQIYVSQYNFDLAGHYSEMWVNGSSFTYIYFGEK